MYPDSVLLRLCFLSFFNKPLQNELTSAVIYEIIIVFGIEFVYRRYPI